MRNLVPCTFDDIICVFISTDFTFAQIKIRNANSSHFFIFGVRSKPIVQNIVAIVVSLPIFVFRPVALLIRKSLQSAHVGHRRKLIVLSGGRVLVEVLVLLDLFVNHAVVLYHALSAFD